MQLTRPSLARPGWAHLRRAGEPWWRVAATVLALLAALVAAIALLAHAIAWSWQPMIILAAGAHYPMRAAPLVLVLALLARRWATAGLGVLLTALVLIIQVPPLVAVDPPAHGTPITVLQANLKLGTADPAAVVDLVRSHSVELLATEELTDFEQQRLIAAGLSRLLPFHYTVPSAGGTGIGMWSKYPLSRQHLDPRFYLKVLTAHVALPGGAGLTFVAAHLEPPFPEAPAEWALELPRFGRLLRALPAKSPVLAAGDYNTTTDHAQFRDLLEQGYADAAEQAGAGYLPSYPTDRWTGPLIGIDHVLTRDAVATGADTVALPGSDHLGLLTHITLDTAPH